MVVRLYIVPAHPVGKVSVMARPRGGDWLDDEIISLRTAGVDSLVSLLTSSEIHEFQLEEEAANCQQHGITYLSFPTVDHSIPPFSAETFEFLERLYLPLAKGKHIAFHCRQGLGRSVLLAACLLVRSGLTAEQACQRLSELRGYEVPETAEQRAWVRAYFHMRQRERG